MLGTPSVLNPYSAAIAGRGMRRSTRMGAAEPAPDLMSDINPVRTTAPTPTPAPPRKGEGNMVRASSVPVR